MPLGTVFDRPLALGSSETHHGSNGTEDSADAIGNIRHNSAGRERNKPCHQRILDQVLPMLVLPELNPKCNSARHVVSLPVGIMGLPDGLNNTPRTGQAYTNPCICSATVS